MTADLDNIRAYCRQNGRVCPIAYKWNELFELLPNRRRSGSGGWEPPAPLILAAWDSPHLSKMMRLDEHLVWADKHGALEEVVTFLKRLPEHEWFHTSD